MTRKERRDEVREILALDTDELVKRANGQLVLFPTLDEVYDYLAEEMVKEFAKAAKGRKIVNFIMPVGPTQPYRLMAEKINYRQISLKNVRFFFMDEYVDDDRDVLIPKSHPLSFRGQIGPLLFDRIRTRFDELNLEGYPVEFRFAEHKNDFGIIGASLLADSVR
jgi:hypothetical protein